jgi:hypothetical protein
MSEQGLANDICASVKGGMPFSISDSGRNPPTSVKRVPASQHDQSKVTQKAKYETPEISAISEDGKQVALRTPNTPGQTELQAKCAGMLPPMSPPKNSSGELAELGDVVRRITEDGFLEDYKKGGENMKILIFLYGREYFKEDERQRKSDIKKMLEMDGLTEDDEAKSTPRKRIFTIIEHVTDSTEMLVEKCNAKMWNESIEDYGEHTIFKLFNIEMVQRIQRQGKCFLHAPAVLQGYLVQKGSNEWKGMMDLAKYVRNGFSSERLSTYIVVDGGGSSLEALTNILEYGLRATNNIPSSDIKRDLESDNPRLLQYLQEHGPALVALFGVDEKFMRVKSSGGSIPFVSHKIILGEDTERHAMVLVGMRRIEKKWRLLLQNWWPEGQLIEVSSETFASSGATVHFALQEQTKIKEEIPTLLDKQAETFVEGCDQPEKVCPER